MESVQMNKEKYNKKSLFNCFKAVVDEDDDFKPPKRRKHGVTTNYVLNPAIADDEDVFLFSPGAKEERGNQQRKRGRETWHALRMAINDTTLMKKILSRRKRKKDSMLRSNNNTKLEIIDKHKTTTHETTSNTSSINIGSSTMFSSSSSLNSSTSSHFDRMSNSSTFEINNTPKPPSLTGTNGISKKINGVFEDKRKRNITLCILWIINLLVLILWGKFFAILCTSIWFYLVPFRHRRKCKERVSSYK